MAGRPTAGPESKSAAVGAAKVLRVAGGSASRDSPEMFLNPEGKMWELRSRQDRAKPAEERWRS